MKFTEKKWDWYFKSKLESDSIDKVLELLKMKKLDLTSIKSEYNLTSMSNEELQRRKSQITDRLQEINGESGVLSTSIQGVIISPKPTLHWDYLLKEMIWLAGDFQKERLRHVNIGKKVSKAIETYNKTKEFKELKKIKDDALALRRISSKLSREVRKFWLKIDKVVTFTQKTDADEVRQKAMDKHLVHLIKQTERYTSLLADNLKTGGEVGMELNRSSSHSKSFIHPSHEENNIPVSGPVIRKKRVFFSENEKDNESLLEDSSSDEDFSLEETEDIEDDETTLIEEEERERDMDVDEEIALLKRESEISVEELRNIYRNLEDIDVDDDENENDGQDKDDHHSDQNDDGGDNDDGDDNDDDDDDYIANDMDAIDDETTLIEEEEKGRDITVEEELKILQDESSISVEQLRTMYAGLENMSDDEENDESASQSEKSPHSSTSSLKNHSEEKDENEDEDDEDFEIDDDHFSEDDERTLIEEEEKGRDIPVEEEIDLLRKESEMSIEELRAMYSGIKDMDSDENQEDDEENEEQKEEDYDDENEEDDINENMIKSKKIDTIVKSKHFMKKKEAEVDKFGSNNSNNNDDDSDDDFIIDEDSMDVVDDETTLIEEEMKSREISVEDELKLLHEEGEMPIERLRAMYADMGDDDDDQDDNEDQDDEQSNFIENSMKISNSIINPSFIHETNRSHHTSRSAEESTDTITEDSTKSENVEDALKRLESADLAARSVHVERPFVLSNNLTLREYQHVGLNWLVSLHERRLNGILADEMGLGKTIQTIAMLAYLAAYRGLWGPHLIVVPTSCIVNWESEFKKWCPIFKILTYYGGAKLRKQLRSGWSKLNSFHVCITSYQLVVQDAMSFRRKRWYYMILDEAHNIKNFRSQRWQTLLNFNTQRRLLLTGTPLQNNLMELWSLMHFLMPHIFRSRKEFSYWFSNPLNNMVEGNRNVNNDIISKLHGIMRPFLLRRLKKDVEKQLPAKYEHIVMCKLSKRQQHLYEEYMSRTSTKSSLSGGNYLGMMNILMQLRKVCNHPDLFEPRPISSPFVSEEIYYGPGKLISFALDIHPLHTLSTNYILVWSYNQDSVMTDELESLKISENEFTTIDDMNIEIDSNLQKFHYQVYVSNYIRRLQDQRKNRIRFNYYISNMRCTKPTLHASWRTINSCKIPDSLPIQAIKARNDAKIRRDLPLCWFDFIKTVDERADQYEDIIRTFVFILPKIIVNKSNTTILQNRSNIYVEYISGCGNHIIPSITSDDISKTINNIKYAMTPFYSASMRQKIFFPDRKLIQFDSGKLQTLSVLLHDLKRGGHKCLIFTQMSKMLDILEIFLNLHGYTYVRLDGSTGVDRRQKLMDRYNSDPKLFCFILSTRSGGLGINLTGADTVIFYDSDWNPAMDAQAQDRAHRIGQTREVHIYRLVSSSTVEENILVKARQKRQLDFLVMTEGNFSEESLFTAHSLKDMLGVSSGQNSFPSSSSSDENGIGSRPIDIEAAMTAVEDAEDVSALRLAEKEVENEQAEFDDNIPIRSSSGDGDEDEGMEGTLHATTIGTNVGLGVDGHSNHPSSDYSMIVSSSSSSSSPSSSSANINGTSDVLVVDKEKEEKDMEQEFASWQASIGPDINALQKALRPVERYAFHLHTEIEPYYSIFYIQEQNRLTGMAAEEKELSEQWDIDAIEREREEEEYRALSEGELLATNLSRKNALQLKSWFIKERSQRIRERRRRIMTGEGWNLIIDPITRVPFWYNDDTGLASYAIPDIIQQKEMITTALSRGYSATPLKIMIHILSYLPTYPDRMNASQVCSRWNEATMDPIFQLKVLPVESGARDSNSSFRQQSFNTFATVDEAIEKSTAGDTIILGAGHHWETSLIIDKAIRLIGDCDDPSKCILELTGEIYISQAAKSVVISTMTIRRPRKIPKRVASITVNFSSVELFHCMVNNEGSQSSSVIVGTNSSRILIFGSTIRGGSLAGLSLFSSSSLIAKSKIICNSGHGISLTDSDTYLDECLVSHNGKSGINVNSSSLLLSRCHIESNELSSMLIDDLNENDSNIRCRDCSGDEDFMKMIKDYHWKDENGNNNNRQKDRVDDNVDYDDNNSDKIGYSIQVNTLSIHHPSSSSSSSSDRNIKRYNNNGHANHNGTNGSSTNGTLPSSSHAASVVSNDIPYYVVPTPQHSKQAMILQTTMMPLTST